MFISGVVGNETVERHNNQDEHDRTKLKLMEPNKSRGAMRCANALQAFHASLVMLILAHACSHHMLTFYKLNSMTLTVQYTDYQTFIWSNLPFNTCSSSKKCKRDRFN